MKTLEKIIKEKEWYYVNSNITSKNFPKPKVIETEGARIIKMKGYFTSQQALDEIKRQGCRPANAWELALFDREKIEKGSWLIAVGQLWRDSNGYHRVPHVLAFSDGGFSFGLGFFVPDWDSLLCLLAFCDKTLDTKKLEKEFDSLSLPDELVINNVTYIKK